MRTVIFTKTVRLLIDDEEDRQKIEMHFKPGEAADLKDAVAEEVVKRGVAVSCGEQG